MDKGINLQATIRPGTSTDAARVQQIEKALPDAFAQANPGLQLTVKSMSPVDARGNSIAHVYIQGEQDPAADFAALAHGQIDG